MFNQNKYFIKLTLLFGCLFVYKVLILHLFAIDYEFIAGDKSIQPSEKQDLSRLYWIISLIGGLIVLTLTYVSWRKYKAEKKKQKKDKNS